MACSLTNGLKLFIASLTISLAASAQTDISNKSWHDVALEMPAQWYATDQALDIADTVVKYQMDNGGWMKNLAFHTLEPTERFIDFDPSGVGATIDNNATMLEMRFLAKIYANSQDVKYRDAFLRGFQFILDAQYDNGGWPQFYPPRPGKSVAYSAYITYNDNAIVNVMELLREIALAKPSLPIDLTEADRQRAQAAFDRGIQNILDCQIRHDGKLTVWCAQHHHETLEPAKARAYELPSYSGFESVRIVELLMSLRNPSPQVIAAIDGAMAWFEANKLIHPDTGAETWARFYDLETGAPFFCDRDGIKRFTLAEVGPERRYGYKWYTDAPARLYPKYLKHKKKHPVRN